MPAEHVWTPRVRLVAHHALVVDLDLQRLVVGRSEHGCRAERVTALHEVIACPARRFEVAQQTAIQIGDRELHLLQAKAALARRE